VKPIFGDTSFYAACLMPRDAHHAQAVGLSQNNRATILTTEFVIVELVNFFSGTNGRSTVADFVTSLRSDPDTIVIPAMSELLQRGFELFSRRPDKEWSLTDCISFVVMEEHGVSEALTSDQDFEQAGFTALLR
jgi:predicted nucleic acid-binding protein